ncbi:MAG: hypothetical protein JSS90_08485 [Bacteroidetes bacterium]|jgi:flagellar basal body-associated protein FliL|nr:hypothetical protein [Bacteroidota bacterium]
MEEEKQIEEEEGKGKRIRVRKRIRIKKKSDPKKKMKKIFRIIVWILVIISFIATIVVLFSESDITYQQTKKQKVKTEFFNKVPIFLNL